MFLAPCLLSNFDVTEVRVPGKAGCELNTVQSYW